MSENLRVARVLYEIAEFYSIKGEFFKSRAYRTAAQQVESLIDNIKKVCEAGKLEEIPGIGKGIGAVVKEYLNTGHSGLLRELRRLLPRARGNKHSQKSLENRIWM
jgi:DNA polymerase (family 10)